MIRAWATVSLLLALASAGVSAAPPPVEAFGNLPQTSGPAMTSDGRLLAWQDESGEAPQVVIFDIDAGKVVRQIRLETDAKLRGILWADNRVLLSTMSFTTEVLVKPRDARQFEMYRTLAIDPDSGEKRELLLDQGARRLVTGARMMAWHLSKPNTVIMQCWDFNSLAKPREIGTHIAPISRPSGWAQNLYAVDTRSGNTTLMERGTPFTNTYVVDRDGNVVARADWRADGKVFVLYRADGSAWQEIVHREGRQPMQLNPFSPDGKTVIAVAPGDDGRFRLWSVALDGSGMRDLLPDVTENIAAAVTDQNTGTLVAAYLGGMQRREHWIDTQIRDLAQRVAKPFPGHDVIMLGHSESNTRAIAEVSSPSTPPVYYLVDFNTHKADIVGEAYPGLAQVTLASVRSITYPARDGTQIPAILTLPPGAGEKSLPLVVLPHGGPAAHDVLAFDWWAQFLASRGYAVLQPQFRGSTGFGEAFERAGHGQWGGLMQDDVSDGVNALISQGVADAKRICIVGASYGGYAALAGAAFTPGLYSCAVSINGVSDLPDMLGYVKEHAGAHSGALDYWRDDIGSSTDARIAAASPARAAERIRVPVLLMHSADDSVVPQSQTDLMATALHKAGRNVTVVTLQGDDHWLSRANTRIQMLRELETFLAANLH
jgi:dipeptidyl aminopeptidase/acylaminoacyl peptidase